jgi:trigger factor
MQSQVQEISPVLVELDVQVPWDDVRKGLEDGISRIQRTARLKGFRPGKVPRNVVKQLFGAQVKLEVLNVLIEKGLVAAIEQHALHPVARPDVAPRPIEEGQPLSFKAKLEVRPKIESVCTEGLVVDKPVHEVSEEDIDREVERLRRQHATLAAPEPARPAEKGDVLTIDYSVSVDGQQRPDLGATDRTVELDGEQLLSEVEAALVGASVGETRTVEVRFADDHAKPDLRGKTATFEVTVKEVKERVLPAVDDEFAKDVGPFQTLLELRADLRRRLEDSARRRSESALRDAVVEKLVDANPVPVPPSLVEQEQRTMMRQWTELVQMATGRRAPDLDEDTLTTLRGRAERKVRAALLLGELARREKLSVSPEEVERKLAEIAERTGKHIAKVRAEYVGERREQLEASMLHDKLLDYLLSKATIAEVRANANEPSEATG